MTSLADTYGQSLAINCLRRSSDTFNFGWLHCVTYLLLWNPFVLADCILFLLLANSAAQQHLVVCGQHVVA